MIGEEKCQRWKLPTEMCRFLGIDFTVGDGLGSWDFEVLSNDCKFCSVRQKMGLCPNYPSCKKIHEIIQFDLKWAPTKKGGHCFLLVYLFKQWWRWRWFLHRGQDPWKSIVNQSTGGQKTTTADLGLMEQCRNESGKITGSVAEIAEKRLATIPRILIGSRSELNKKITSKRWR